MTEKEEKNNAWFFITGLLAGLLGWFMAAELFAIYRHNQAVEQYNKAIQQIAEIAPPTRTTSVPSLADQVQQRQEETARQRLEAKKLAPDERCFNGQRFRRLENGWQQLPNRPC